MSRSRLLVAAALLVLAPALAAAQAVNRAAIAKQLEANERAVNAALAKGDVATFRKFVADEGAGIDANGFSLVADFLKMVPQMKVETWAIDNYRVTWINDTTALGTFRWTGKGTFMGQPFPSPMWASTIWVNRGGNWVAVFHQETEAAPPPPAKK